MTALLPEPAIKVSGLNPFRRILVVFFADKSINDDDRAVDIVCREPRARRDTKTESEGEFAMVLEQLFDELLGELFNHQIPGKSELSRTL